ncbi:alpha/beta hydrolase [Noviherbaspirillum cavernae]|uniref:Alpha/beta hydrolase n=1 Tax=Noviherbaspirillum cavernae TaxID=2320862 RepID=A0A418WZF0_9BURK|nr:alpha/beta hydrolase [Noviherbaspirillum cavernae]RJG05455.1 alpha/beta hydrolase [Noviherbaspirillum cavernae]
MNPGSRKDVVADGVTVGTLVVQGERNKLDARLYTPTPEPALARHDDQKLIVFFPPGGFVTSELDAIDPFVRGLAEITGCKVLASTYTVADVQPFPAAVEDAHALLKWAARHKAKLGWDGKHLITAGLEAGGNLAAVSALMARDRGGPALAAQILIMPMLDPGLTSCSMRTIADDGGAARAAGECAAGYRDYLPRAIDRTHPYASPLQSSRMKGLPPALILSADDDPLRDEAEQYGAKLLAAGIRAVVKRLPPIELEQPDARCSCVRKESVLQEIAAFVAGLDAAKSA